MKNTLALLFVVAITASLSAQVVPFNGILTNKFLKLNSDGTVVETSGPANPQEVLGTFYSSIDQVNGYSAFPAATGPIGFDDYTLDTLPAGDTDVAVESFRFVGGVGTANGLATFDFFDATGVTNIGSFSVALASSGNFIYDIDVIATNLLLPTNAVVQMTVDATTDPVGGQFFLHGDGPTIGTNDMTFGGANGGTLIHAFEITGNSVVPEPASMLTVLLGLAGLAMARRS